MRTTRALLLFATALLVPASADAQKIYINPSNQVNNAVCRSVCDAQGIPRATCVESTYAMKNSNIAKPILEAAGFTVKIDDDFTNAPIRATNEKYDAFLSVHSNAGGGHGPETLRGWYGDSVNFSSKLQNAILKTQLHNYRDRGCKDGNCGTGRCYVLNTAKITAGLVEVVFHDCCDGSGNSGHPPSEAAYLLSSAGQQAIGKGLAQGVCDYYGKSCTGTAPPTGQIVGVVYKNGDLKQHVKPATVKLNTGATVTFSGSMNDWRFTVPSGVRYSVTVSAAGFKTKTHQCPNEVPAGGIAYCSVELEPDTGAKGFVKGVVYQNGDTKNHVMPATVKLNTGATQVFDSSSPGNVWSFEVAPGSYSVTASATGYKTATRQCPDPVVAGATSWCSVEVVKEPVVIPPDASVPMPPDASTPIKPDASTPIPPDAAWIEPPDAAWIEPPDAAYVEPPDAGVIIDLDAGVEPPDAAPMHAGAIEPPDGACGCSAASNGGLGLLALPFLLLGRGALRRRPQA
jgi:hypothetical protein